ncbi:MAG: NADH-quinone oxidoreductase subunit [Verrucomicrobiota bacterium]
MSVPFIIIALLTIASAVSALTLRNVVHCALALTVTFAGLAALYLQLDAQFVGFAQLLVYVGAVAILIVFAILLTRGAELPQQSIFSSHPAVGLTIAAIVFALLARMIVTSRALNQDMPAARSASVQQIGDQLMTKYILPLEVIGLLLTAALIGAVIIAMREKEGR